MDKSTLLSYMPEFYKTSQVIDNINTTNATELTKANSNLDNTLNNFFILTATETTIERWEKIYGLKVVESNAIENRRYWVLYHMRGQGTATITLIKNVAESFGNGDVAISENNAEYTFTIKFIGMKGIPINLDDIKYAISEIKPAHLNTNYEFTWNDWKFIKGLKWGTLKQDETWQTMKVRY